MSLTTNTSPIRGKLDEIEGEYEGNIKEVAEERDPAIDYIEVGENREYVIRTKKSFDKKDEKRKKLRHQTGRKIKMFVKKGG